MADAPRGGFVGFVERVLDGGRLQGWVIDLDRLTSPVRLRAYADDRLVGETVADQDRPDVHGAGFPRQRCGFDLQIAAWAQDGVGRELRFETNFGAVVRLPGMDRLCVVASQQSIEAAVAVDARGGRLDFLSAGRIGGWSLDTATGEPRPIEILCDGELVAQADCSRFRGDLLHAFGASGGAFDVELPSELWDGVDHDIEVRADGVLLDGGPLRFTADEQRLHMSIRALRSGAGVTSLIVIADLLEDHVLTPAAAISAESRAVARHLASDMLTHADIGGGPRAAAAIIDRFLASGWLPLTAPPLSPLLSDIHGLGLEDAMERTIASLDAEAPDRALLSGSIALQSGEVDDGVGRLCAAAAGGEVLGQRAASLLLAAGRIEDAARALRSVVEVW